MLRKYIVIFSLLLTSNFALAMSTNVKLTPQTGGLWVKVTDDSGNPIKGAIVNQKNLTNKHGRVFLTNHFGRNFKVKVEHAGDVIERSIWLMRN